MEAMLEKFNHWKSWTRPVMQGGLVGGPQPMEYLSILLN